MSTATLDSATARVEAAIDALLAACDPKKVDNVTFRGARFDHGLAWVHFPEGHGGLGVRPELNRIVEERLRKAGAAPQDPATFFIALAGPTIVTHGSEEVKKRFLRPMFTGEEKWCQLFSEPGAGSDFAGLGTKAVRDGDEWIVNGQKVWNTLAHLADWGMLVTRTDPEAPKHKGMTYFALDMRSPGVEVRPLRQITGEAEFNEVYMTDARVPDAHRIGDVGEGWRVALTTLMNERASIGTGNAGDGNLLTRVTAMVRHYGLDKDPLVRVQLADLIMNYRVASMNGQRAAAKIKMGQLPGPEMSITKMALVNNQAKLVKFLSHTLGPKLIADSGEWGTYAWANFVLGTPGLRIAGGSDEVMRNITGERVLGLPKEPGIDSVSPFRDIKVSTPKK